MKQQRIAFILRGSLPSRATALVAQRANDAMRRIALGSVLASVLLLLSFGGLVPVSQAEAPADPDTAWTYSPRGHLDDVLGMIERKNQAVPADAFAVPAAPFFSLERLYVSFERLITHLAQALEEQCCSISGEFFELLGGLF